MKRMTSFVLALCLLVPLGVCSAFANSSATGSWEIDHYVDDFGDPTDDVYIRGIFTGVFSDTETAGSFLTAIVCFDPESAAFSFRMLELGNKKAAYSSDEEDAIEFKIKVSSGDIYEGTLIGIAPNEDLYLTGSDDLSTVLEVALLSDEEIRCVINIGNSKYNFTIDGIGFRSCLTEFGILPYVEAQALRETEDYDGAVAYFEWNDQNCVITDSGGVLGLCSDPERLQGMIHVINIMPADAGNGEVSELDQEDLLRLDYLKSLLCSMEELDIIENVAQLDMADITDPVFLYLDRFDVHMGCDHQIDYKLRMFIAAMSQLGETEIGTINLSDGVTVRFTPA